MFIDYDTNSINMYYGASRLNPNRPWGNAASSNRTTYRLRLDHKASLIGQRIWWGIVRYQEAELPWQALAATDMTGVTCSDPDVNYGAWLRENVGRQHWDWQWYAVDYETLRLRVREKHAAALSAFLLLHI